MTTRSAPRLPPTAAISVCVAGERSCHRTHGMGHKLRSSLTSGDARESTRRKSRPRDAGASLAAAASAGASVPASISLCSASARLARASRCLCQRLRKVQGCSSAPGLAGNQRRTHGHACTPDSGISSLAVCSDDSPARWVAIASSSVAVAAGDADAAVQCAIGSVF